MIGYVRGEIADLSEDMVVLDVNGIGVNIRISSGFAAKLPSIGALIKIFTYTYVKEDAFILYGFSTKDELELFKKMITVNGIGPKGALAILSVMNANELRFAIYSGDVKAISKAPGIGGKTAERLILDLRDKVKLEDAFAMNHGMQESESENLCDNKVKQEAAEALMALGYGSSDAAKAINRINVNEETDVETVLKAALKYLL